MSYATWEARTAKCACVSPDPRACISIRYTGCYVSGTPGSSLPYHEREDPDDWSQDERCECACHAEHADEEEYDDGFDG